MSIDSRIESARHDCLKRADQLIAELKSLKQKIRRGVVLNSLGELQSLPGLLDCRVAALAELLALKRGDVT